MTTEQKNAKIVGKSTRTSPGVDVPKATVVPNPSHFSSMKQERVDIAALPPERSDE
jgi:hypothetical protein